MNVHIPTSFHRRETRPVVPGDEKRQSVLFMMSPRESLVSSLARQLSTYLESLEISCRQENSQSAFSVVAWVLLHAHPSLRTAQGGYHLSFGRCV